MKRGVQRESVLVPLLFFEYSPNSYWKCLLPDLTVLAKFRGKGQIFDLNFLTSS